MRLSTLMVAALAAFPSALAVDQSKSVIVWFEKAVPQSIVDKAKADIVSAGGKITHTYSLINGFAAIAPVKAIETVQAWGKTDVRIEEDKMVSVTR